VHQPVMNLPKADFEGSPIVFFGESADIYGIKSMHENKLVPTPGGIVNSTEHYFYLICLPLCGNFRAVALTLGVLILMLASSIRWFFRGRTFLSAFCLVSLLLASGCSDSKSSDSNQTAAPSNLVYPAAIIPATTGQLTSTDTPAVSGTVNSYSITPALPAGLSLNTSTGTISGTPTASSPQTTYTITATNVSGSATTNVTITVNPAPPTGLNYPQTAITATVGQAITAITPTVTGAVSSYTVAPFLPAGLSINTTTGGISGTPTTVAAQATYTVTASNASGSTTASFTITVNPAVPPPSSLAYPQTNVTAPVGQSIIPNIPSFTGTVTAFTVDPAFPAGVSLDPSTGAIIGTPTAQTAQVSYTITASNPGGSTTAAITFAVNKQYTTVLELGHASGVTLMRSMADRLLSQDGSRHWVLWDTDSDSEMASGDSTLSASVDMAGTTIAVGQRNGLEVRSSVDGHVLSVIAAPTMINPDPRIYSGKTWWKLASDGSYLCAGSSAGLAVWSSGGQQMLFRAGDYSSANAFAAPGQIQIALGPAGQSVIETVTVGSGSSSVGSSFSGTFNSWFLDGHRFLTYTGTTVWTYSAASVQEAIVSLPNISNLSGQGNWISTYGPSGWGAIYAVGSSSPSTTFGVAVFPLVVASGTTLATLDYGNGFGSVYDLSGSTSVKTDFTTPISYLSAFTATTTSKWFAANTHGVIVDGLSTDATRTLSLGQAWSIAGGTTRVAVATANGSIFYLNPAAPTATNRIAFSSSKLALSIDDIVLAASANATDSQYQTDRTLNVYSLPSRTVTTSLPYSLSTSGPYLRDFLLSGSGNVLGQILFTSSGTKRTVSPIAGGAPIWSDSFNDTLNSSITALTPSGSSVQLSPDGSLIAAADGLRSDTVGTKIYKNGVLVTAVPGWPLVWLDDSRLLVKSYTLSFPSYDYAGSTIYDSSGAKLATPPIPELVYAQPVEGGQIYSSDQNSIFSLTTGTVTWTGGSQSATGAVAGQYVVFVQGSKVVLDNY
jgi:hypothetical protein